MTHTVSKLADRGGLSADTIRYYERAGLLPPPTRTASGYRAFDDDAVERLRFIKGAQRIGLRLALPAVFKDRPFVRSAILPRACHPRYASTEPSVARGLPPTRRH